MSLKELWIEIEKDDYAGNMRALASQYSDVIIENNKATFLESKKILDVVSPHSEGVLENLKNNILRICISSKETEDLAVRAAQLGVSYLIISCANWHVIPLENLIARIKSKGKLIAEVANAEEAKIALEILELGTDGVLLKTSDPDELLKIVAVKT
jgi:3-dehydroquinate synthase class II